MEGRLEWILVLLWGLLAIHADPAECSKFEILPWSQYLSPLIPDIEATLAPDVLETFRKEINSLVPNRTLNTRRPFSPDRRSDRFSPNAEQIGHESRFRMHLYALLIKRYRVARERAQKLVNKQSSYCKIKTPLCNPVQSHRTIDGSCNNLAHPFWGASSRPFERILPAAYEDGFWVPRGGQQGGNLPNPRNITTTIHYDVINPDPTITNMVPQIGQFVDHDLTLAPEGDRRCCSTEQSHEDCFPIPIPSNDPFYSTLPEPQTCMSFTRSTPFCFPGLSCMREQFNVLTAFLDASQVYGSDKERADQLREYKGGRLLAHPQNKNLLPTVAQVEAIHNTEIAVMGKFLAGDDRVNEMPGLTVMHTLLFREHNRVAGQIASHKPNWNDQKIFEHARRIVIAQWQNVVYGEYLPVILGTKAMKKHRLQLDDGYSKYDPAINPTIVHAFSTAAYRFGHTLVNGIIQLYKGLQAKGSYPVKDNFFESEQIESNNADGYNLILGGLMVQNSQTYDPHVTVALTNFLLRERKSDFGSDLLARNVQRGRDHGLPPYANYRRYCQLTPLTTWENKPEEILQEFWDLLKTLYQSPQDIDLFTGGLSEQPLVGAFSGATFNCLKALQFSRLKYGDRFFFTHGGQAGSFKVSQLQHLRTRTLGDIICENSATDTTPVNVFRTASDSNPHLYCNDPVRTQLDFKLLLG